VWEADCNPVVWSVRYRPGSLVIELNAKLLYDCSMKVCSNCKQEKPPEGFHKCSRRRDGLQNECKDCRAGRHRETYADRKEYLAIHRKIAEGKYRAMREAMAIEQGYVCPCGQPLGTERALDHDHACCDKDVRHSCRKCDRAVMHILCNLAIGMVEDDPQKLRNLADYIEKYQSRLGPMDRALPS
jgi:hypothetical protein